MKCTISKLDFQYLPEQQPIKLLTDPFILSLCF